MTARKKGRLHIRSDPSTLFSESTAIEYVLLSFALKRNRLRLMSLCQLISFRKYRTCLTYEICCFSWTLRTLAADFSGLLKYFGDPFSLSMVIILQKKKVVNTKYQNIQKINS
jgi:hypothetical protein